MKILFSILFILVIATTTVDPPGTWDYMTLIGPPNLPFEMEVEGDGTLSNEHYNIISVYDSSFSGGYSILLVENYQQGIDEFVLCGGRIEVNTPFNKGRLIIIKIADPIYRNFQIFDRNNLNLKLTILSEIDYNRIIYKTKVPLVVATTKKTKHGQLNLVKLNVTLRVANGVRITMNDSEPETRGWGYPYLFYYNIYDNQNSYKKWVLEFGN